MKKIISLILIIMFFKYLVTTKPIVIFPVISIIVVLFLIRTMFRGAFGKRRNGKTGSIYDDYL